MRVAHRIKYLSGICELTAFGSHAVAEAVAQEPEHFFIQYYYARQLIPWNKNEVCN